MKYNIKEKKGTLGFRLYAKKKIIIKGIERFGVKKVIWSHFPIKLIIFYAPFKILKNIGNWISILFIWKNSNSNIAISKIYG